VGPALAKAIIDYRTKHGAFRSFADLDKVPGIGPKTLEKFKDRVTFR
jgi:competence protein ComEA